MTETTTPLQPTTVEPTKLQPTTPAQPNAPTAPDSPHVTETPSPDHLLTLTDLTRQFVRRGTPFDAVSHVNLTVDAGEFIAIVGRSGNGKSTLINMVAGLIRPTSGTVSVAGRNVADLGDKALSVLRNRTIGFVTQSQTLLGNLTVLDNVILPATMFPEPLPFAQNAEATDAVAQAAATNDEAAADSAADPFMPDVIAPITDQKTRRQTRLRAVRTCSPPELARCSPSLVLPIWQTATRASCPAVKCGASPSPAR